MPDIEESINTLINTLNEMIDKGEKPSEELVDTLKELSVLIS